MMGFSFAMLVGLGFVLQSWSDNPTAKNLGHGIVILFAIVGALAASGAALMVLFLIVCLATWR